MTKQLILVCLLLLGLVPIPHTGNAQVKTYKLSTGRSLLVWYCQEDSPVPVLHSGSFLFSEGTFTTTAGEITAGSFEVDMSSLIDNDIRDKQQNHALASRLAAPDFFNIKDYPRARFAITQVEMIKPQQYILEGMLTLKGKSRLFRLPVTVKTAADQLEIVSDNALIEGVQFGLKTATSDGKKPELKNFKVRISQLFAKKV